MAIRIIQQGGEALAECGRGNAQINDHIVNLPLDHPHQLALGLPELIVHAAQDALTGLAVIVLNKSMRAALGLKFILTKSFHKETAFVAVDNRDHQHWTIRGQRLEFHLFPFSAPATGAIDIGRNRFWQRNVRLVPWPRRLSSPAARRFLRGRRP